MVNTISNSACLASSNVYQSSMATQHSNEQFQSDCYDVYVGVSNDYFDHGHQDVICTVCKAKLWKDESKRGLSTHKSKIPGSYSLCCRYGKVELPSYNSPSPEYENLFKGIDATSKFFLRNIRRYNSIFSFTSMGGKIDTNVNRGGGPYIFKLGSQNYHRIGSLKPNTGCKPKFSQLYIYDTDNEISNRHDVLSDPSNMSSENDKTMDLHIIQLLKEMLETHNVLVKTYRTARDTFQDNPQIDLKIRLIANRSKDGRQYNLPTSSEVAALIVGDLSESLQPRDVVVTTQSRRLQFISELHPSYIPLQYPIIFINGEDGYHVQIYHRGIKIDEGTGRFLTSMREWFAFRIQDRLNQFSILLNLWRLLQQFLVDAYTMIEAERLVFIRSQQTKLRSITYENLKNLRDQGTSDVSKVGRSVILPSSFTGGARYMTQDYLDAMTFCKFFGYPDYFITITCNPKWHEVKRFLKDSNLSPEDRPDILCRLFKIKHDSMLKDLRDKKILGPVRAFIYTIEFHKRGLPHAHLCLFIQHDHKLHSIDEVDPFISAEIPDKDQDPELYYLVSDLMIHGPCGHHNPKCSCMVENKCSKQFPKTFHQVSSVDSEGYPLYRRRNDGRFVQKGDTKLDNRSVVPYNSNLLKRYQAHINVEWCNQASSIKYLFKYINKGPDRATVYLSKSNSETVTDPVDEIKQYYDCRYISACEAAWRIFGYDVHMRSPAITRLHFHLPGQQNVVYGADDHLDSVLEKNQSVSSSMFTEWMKCNQEYPEARNLTYVEFPTKYVFHNTTRRCWKPRKSGYSVGRIHTVSPALGEAYFLRILLNIVKGPTSYEDIRTVNGRIQPSFRDACYSLGLLDDDREYIEAIEEASHSTLGHGLRILFATMLSTDSLSRPEHVWMLTWNLLSDGILYNQRRILKSPELLLNDDQIKNLTLFEIEKILLLNNSTLRKYKSMPFPDEEYCSVAFNRLINEELSYDQEILTSEFSSLFNSITDEQKYVFDRIINVVQNNQGGVFFLYGYGGTGKTYLWNLLSTALRSKGEIVLTVASSGIAALLLPGGRTAHSWFHIPINLNEDSNCYMDPATDEAQLLEKTKLIIWDEAPMAHKHGIQALNRSLKDVLASNKLFGGKVVVFGGDFRQILPVVNKGSRQDIVNASLCSSYIWSDCHVMKLTKNMRLTMGSSTADVEEINHFANWLLDIGEGNAGGPNDGNATITIPDDLLIKDSDDPLSRLFDFVYPDLIQNYHNEHYFNDRAILAPTNDVVDNVNETLLKFFPGHEMKYLSSDSICQDEYVNDNVDESLYSPEILNSLRISGLPNHRLILKVGVPIMLLINLNQKEGLCNGTRLQVTSLGVRVIEAKIISGKNIGHTVLIHRSPLTPTDNKIPYKFQRRQFPIAVCFAMTINKSQGQSLKRVGLYLKEPVFSHGQLYVALSRVTNKHGLKILILDKQGRLTNTTSNVVYKEIFSYL